MIKKLQATFLLTFVIGSIFAQIGGNNVYEFLNLPTSARVTALGGNLITVMDDDIALSLANPSTLNPAMHNALSFNHNLYFDGIQNGYVAFGREVKKLKSTFHAGMQYASYGEFNRTDELGQIIGTFKAAEYAFTLGGGYRLYEKVNLGANLRMITSQFEAFTSLGLAADLGVFYQDTSSNLNVTLVVKNMGAQLTTYNDIREPIPTEIEVGVSKQLKHLPFRFSIIYKHLQKWNILYDDPNAEDETLILGDTEGSSADNGNPFIDNLFRHFVFNGEFLLGKKENFRIRVGYAHQRRAELSVDPYISLTGFSGGVGLKINRFRIDYGRSFYHLAGGANHFSISTNLSEFRR